MATHVTREAELFVILVDLLGDKKLERNALRVLVGTRGFELGRPYMHLCQQGLIAEETVRPSFWRRLLGAKETLWVRVTDHGLQIAAKAFAEDDPAPAAPQSFSEAPAAEVPPKEEPAPAASAPAASAPAAPAFHALAREVEAPEVLAAEALAAEIPVESQDRAETIEENGIVEQAAASAIAPPTMPLDAPADQPAAPSQVETQAQPLAEPAAVMKPAPREKAAPPRRFAVTDFTETLGGVALDSDFQAPSSDRLDDLAENLGLLGFELTDAGKLLAVNRWAQGGSDPEVALEVISTALAHAARLSASGTAELDHDIALTCARRVQETFAVFVSEGLLDAETLTHWADQMTRFLMEPVSSSGLEAYLLDPWRGIAPPAVCPEEIYVPNEIDAD